MENAELTVAIGRWVTSRKELAEQNGTPNLQEMEKSGRNLAMNWRATLSNILT